MDTSLLNEFIVLADTGNYVTAAESLFLSQPTLSRHIKRLEEDLGTGLFERNAGRLALTPEGQIFLPYAKKMLSVEKECRTALRQSSGSNPSALNIGTIPMMGAYGITDLIQRFQRACPDIVLHMNILSQREMRQALEDGRIDFAFLREFRKSEDTLTRIPMAQDRIVLILPKLHPLAKEESLRLTQVRNEKLIFPARDSDTYRAPACRPAGRPDSSLRSSLSARGRSSRSIWSPEIWELPSPRNFPANTPADQSRSCGFPWTRQSRSCSPLPAWGRSGARRRPS